MEIDGVCDLHCNVRMVLERRMRWPAHVAWVGWQGDRHKVLVEKPEGKNHLGRLARRLCCVKGLCVGCVVLKWILRQGGWVQMAQDVDHSGIIAISATTTVMGCAHGVCLCARRLFVRTASVCSSLPTCGTFYQSNLKIKQFKNKPDSFWSAWTLKMGLTGRLETSATTTSLAAHRHTRKSDYTAAETQNFTPSSSSELYRRIKWNTLTGLTALDFRRILLHIVSYHIISYLTIDYPAARYAIQDK
jgi:hypothetical protein